MSSHKWDKTTTELQIEEKAFSEGAFRQAHKCLMMYRNKQEIFVCKFAKDKDTPRTLYYNDIEAQVYAYQWAKKFNEGKTPRKITFVPAFVLELVDRPGRPVCGCERLIKGEFRKHNNNVGAVCTYPGDYTEESKMDVKIAQAFSHFTYSNSNGQILICDIQGVEGMYTDPQIHTISGKGFGSGNLGSTGIRAFLLRHECNNTCQVMGLAVIKPSQLGEQNVQTVHHRNSSPGPNSSALISLPDPNGGTLQLRGNNDRDKNHPKSPEHSEWAGVSSQSSHAGGRESDASSPTSQGSIPASSSPTNKLKPSATQKGNTLQAPKNQKLRPPSAENFVMTSMDERLMDSILND